MIFILVFCALAVSMASLSGVNLQIADNQRKANSALSAAQSGLDVGKYLVNGYSKTSTIKTAGDVTQIDRNNTWNAFRTYISNPSNTVAGKPWTDTGPDLVSSYINFGSNNDKFQVKYHYDGNNITLESTGIIPTSDGSITKKATVGTNIERNGDVLNYAIASRGRMWLTGDSTIHGDIFSAWNLSTNQLAQLTQLQTQIQQQMNNETLNSTTFASLVSSLGLTSSQRTTILNELLNGTLSPSSAASRCISCMSSVPSISPFNLTSDSEVLGTINTCWSKEQIKNKSWQLETLDANGNPMYDQNGNKIISPEDEIQGQCDGINYGVPPQNMSGMKISDYDTTVYYNKTRTANGGNGDITTSSTTRTEYFPHGVNSDGTNNYQKLVSGSLTLTRHVYTSQTFNNIRLKASDNALFQNCTFNNVLYVDCGKTTSNYNNVRFDNCTFNGTIVTNTPQTFNWQKNTLYYTGSATFQNTSADATILAPHFNVNLGNTNPVAGTDNVLHGAIVGGIVDVRGNAEVFGTIISMADTSSYTSGYVSNIGATLNDGGSETVAIGDVGTIHITPDPDKLLPSGITTPIVIKPLQDTYSEG
jgi:hypothetical protein